MNTGRRARVATRGCDGPAWVVDCASFICEFNEGPPVVREVVWAFRLPSGRQCATILIQVQERDLSWYQKHHPRAPRTAKARPSDADSRTYCATARRAASQPRRVGLPNSGRPAHARPAPRGGRPASRRRAPPGARGSSRAATWALRFGVGEAISDALGLKRAEHAHLVLLGHGEEVAPARAPKETVDPTIRRLVQNLDPNPACITGRRFDILAWNRAYAAIFGDPAKMPDGRRNMLWRLFTDPASRKLHPDWEEGARRIVARFRGEAARYVGDPDFEDLISALQERSPEFREWWDLHEVATSGVGRKVLNHPTAGKLYFEHAPFRPYENPEQRLVLYSAVRQGEHAGEAGQAPRPGSLAFPFRHIADWLYCLPDGHGDDIRRPGRADSAADPRPAPRR